MPPMSTISERDRLSKELKLAHQDRMEASCKVSRTEGRLKAAYWTLKSLTTTNTSTYAATLEDLMVDLHQEFEKDVEILAGAQERVLKLEDQLLNQ